MTSKRGLGHVTCGFIAAMLVALPSSGVPQSSNVRGASAPTAEFGAWVAGCDNLLTCEVVSSDVTETVALSVTRDGPAFAAPRIGLQTSQSTAPGSVEVIVDDLPAMKTIVDVSETNGLVRSAQVNAKDVAALLDAGLRGQTLKMRGLSRDSIEFSLKGFSAALRWVDAKQGRAGTRSALVAKGPATDPTLAQPQAPRIGPAGAMAKMAPDEVIRLATLTYARRDPDPDMSADCYGLNDKDEVDPSNAMAFQLTPHLAVLLLACDGGQYNRSYSFYPVDPKTGKKTSITIDDTSRFFAKAGDGQTVPQVSNPTIDLASASLTQNFLYRAQGDCGWSTTWLWDGRRFVLAGSSEMPACRGLIFPEWITTYQTLRAKR